FAGAPLFDQDPPPPHPTRTTAHSSNETHIILADIKILLTTILPRPPPGPAWCLKCSYNSRRVTKACSLTLTPIQENGIPSRMGRQVSMQSTRRRRVWLQRDIWIAGQSEVRSEHAW